MANPTRKIMLTKPPAPVSIQIQAIELWVMYCHHSKKLISGSGAMM